MSGNRNEKIRDISLLDVTPLSLGMASGTQRAMGVFIPRNSRIPITVKRTSTTTSNGQCSGRVAIYEGESSTAVNNNFLGEFILDHIPPPPVRWCP